VTLATLLTALTAPNPEVITPQSMSQSVGQMPATQE
jgi:hypothetical protein